MVKREIQKAKDIFSRFGKQILQDEKCSELLKNYRGAIESNWETISGLEVIKTCAACSDKWAGGCCFKGVEDWYDHVLFLLNLLLGVKIKESRTVMDGCLFVGPTGCTLISRHSFCINYLCDRIKTLLSQTEKKRLLSVAGEEIYWGIQTEQSIRKWLGQNIST